MTTYWIPHERVLVHNPSCYSIIVFPFGVALVHSHNTGNPCVKLRSSDRVHLPCREVGQRMLKLGVAEIKMETL